MPTVSRDVLAIVRAVSKPAWLVTNGNKRTVVVDPAGRTGQGGGGSGFLADVVLAGTRKKARASVATVKHAVKTRLPLKADERIDRKT